MATREELRASLPALRKAWEQKILSKLSVTQAKDRQDKPAAGPVWVSRCRISPPPENDLRSLVFKVIQHLASDGNQKLHDSPPAEHLSAEWLGTRGGVDRKAAEPTISENEKYQQLTRETGENAPVVLFLHGGNLTFGGPVTYRPFLQRLSKIGHVRCFTPAYRLAPKNIFPSALIDALSAYLYLLAPPAGAYHQAYKGSQIILAGESAGCSLTFALVKVLLVARDLGLTSVSYHGVDVALDLPAGVTAFSPYCDFTVSLPSERLNMEHDIFLKTLINPVNDPRQIDAAVDWPSQPARHDYCCLQDALDHPLTSPVAVTDWTGAPPVWICAGGHERPLDSAKVVAQRLATSGAQVQFEMYAEMPHAWFSFLPKTPSTSLCLSNWATAVRGIVARQFVSKARSFDAWTQQQSSLCLESLVPFPLEQLALLMRAEKVNRRPVGIRPVSHL